VQEDQSDTATPGDETGETDDGHDALTADVVMSVESSGIVSVDSSATECTDSGSTVAVGTLEHATLYLLQPVESASAQNIACRTLRLLTGDCDEADSSPAAVLVATSAADVISGSAELAYFLRSADIKHEPAAAAAAAAGGDTCSSAHRQHLSDVRHSDSSPTV